MVASNVSNTRPEREIPESRRRRDELTEELLGRWDHTSGRSRTRLIERLVEVNMPVARLLARHYSGRGIPTCDLEQVAYVGLTAAARRFDPARGRDFLAYAVPTIKGELRRAFRDSGWAIRPPRRLQELQANAWSAEADLVQEIGRAPTTEELADRLGVEESDVVEIRSMEGCFAPHSLDMPLGEDDSGTVADRQGGADPGFDRCEARVTLAPVVRPLGERDRRILELRFFEGWTQQQIGEEIGVTQMQVSRLLTRILAHLRRQITGEQAA